MFSISDVLARSYIPVEIKKWSCISDTIYTLSLKRTDLPAVVLFVNLPSFGLGPTFNN